MRARRLVALAVFTIALALAGCDVGRRAEPVQEGVVTQTARLRIEGMT